MYIYWEKTVKEAPAVASILSMPSLLHFSCFEPCVSFGCRRKREKIISV